MTLEKNTVIFSAVSETCLYGCRRGTKFYEKNGKKICVFTLYAPGADSVSLCGDFCDWENGIPMAKNGEGVWEATAENVKNYDCYKFKIQSRGKTVYKSDPYAMHFETPPKNASRIYDPEMRERSDGEWIKKRKEYSDNITAKPLNIYRLHLGSWKKKYDGNPYSYREAAQELAVYVKRMGYTHVELMPLVEHTDDSCCGFVSTGLFAPTSRYGTPCDFSAFTDILHCAGIGIILDMPFERFSKDEHGLSLFDGTELYEKKGFDFFGNSIFDTDKEAVKDLLISCTLFWIRRFFVDGIHVYCGSSPEFARELCRTVHEYAPDVFVIGGGADTGPFDLTESCNFLPDISGFCRDGIYISEMQDKSIVGTGRTVMPFSYGVQTAAGKVPGDFMRKMTVLRAYAVYLMSFPGKKLTFMGNEIGQINPWDCCKTVEWQLLGYELHRKMSFFFESLNNLYLSHGAFWEKDGEDGTYCPVYTERGIGITAFMRYGNSGDGILCVVNCEDVPKHGIALKVPSEGVYSVIFCSEDEKYGGEYIGFEKNLKTVKDYFGKNQPALILDMPQNCGMILSVKKKKTVKRRAHTVSDDS